MEIFWDDSVPEDPPAPPPGCSAQREVDGGAHESAPRVSRLCDSLLVGFESVLRYLGQEVANVSLDQAAKIVTMVSAIAVPITIGIVGWNVQEAIAVQGLRKDYTSMALQILTKPDDGNQSDLRQWAVDLLDQNAPLPFSNKVRRQLLGGIPVFGNQLEMKVPDVFMSPPLGWVDVPKDGFGSESELNKNYVENLRRASLNAASLRSLQDSVRSYQTLQRELEISFQEIDKESREREKKQ